MVTTFQVVEREIVSLRPYARNARTHSKKQIKQIAKSIERFGFTNPVLISDEGEIIAGHGRVEAARLLGRKAVPTLALSHLSETERRAYVLADNKLALNAGWDREILAIELQALVELDFEAELTGFSLAEIDLVIDEAGEADPEGCDEPEDAVVFASGTPVSRQGDLWQLDRHRLLCGDARKREWGQEIERCRKAGIPEPEPIPHPDDILLDPDTGNVRVLGPQTKEQKERLDEALARRAEAQEEVNYYAGKYRRTRDPARKAQWLEEWHFEQRMFDIINDVMSPRYKARLHNRSWAEGASREGKNLDEINWNKDLRA